MTVIFAESGFLSDVVAVIVAMTGLIGAILAFLKYLDERKRRLDAEKRESEAEEQNLDLEEEVAELKGRATRYQALREHLLARRHLPSVRMTFAEIGALLGEPLPRSALKYRAWWGNITDTSKRPQAAAWAAAGFKVGEVHQELPEGWVEFVRKNKEDAAL